MNLRAVEHKTRSEAPIKTRIVADFNTKDQRYNISCPMCNNNDTYQISRAFSSLPPNTTQVPVYDCYCSSCGKDFRLRLDTCES